MTRKEPGRWFRTEPAVEISSIACIEYYLSRHDFAVDAADVDAGVEAGFVVGVNHVAPKGLIGTGSTVVWSLPKINK